MMKTRIYTIKPKPTQYLNTWFRSRLEARWAIFFKALDIDYEYEKEVYKYKDTIYRPDFYLKNVPYQVVEIKPDEPTWLEYDKCLTTSLKKPTVIFSGPIHPEQMSTTLFRNGKEISVNGLRLSFRSKLFKRNMAALREVLGPRRDFIQAFKRAYEYKF